MYGCGVQFLPFLFYPRLGQAGIGIVSRRHQAAAVFHFLQNLLRPARFGMLPHFKPCFVPLGVLLPLGQIGNGLVAAVQLQQGFQAVGIGLCVGNLTVVFQTVGIADALLLPPLSEPARAHALRGGLGHGFRRQFRQPCFGRLCQRAAVRYGAEMDAAACFGQTHQHRGIAVAQFEIADVRLPAGSLR